VVDYWEDTQIRAGSDWRDEILKAIEKARVAVLLLSADFLASNFIATDELPPLLRAASEDGAKVLPLIVSPCRFLKTPSLSRFQSVNPSTPLIAMSRAESEAMLVKLTDAVEEAFA
ncbi:MAG TPA: toll/interleukin-1 receptor domain-containing protein, partial [Candidatus Acidoferrum sp.]|nr:toll/interleukin-1 receptor domain-containing protein [Candidatus Acidoferrum sp.]